jgi:hypothetical protein
MTRLERLRHVGQATGEARLHGAHGAVRQTPSSRHRPVAGWAAPRGGGHPLTPAGGEPRRGAVAVATWQVRVGRRFDLVVCHECQGDIHSGTRHPLAGRE